jgi:Co/Zn/Cd efflux system component
MSGAAAEAGEELELVRYRVLGMASPSCGARIEAAARRVIGTGEVTVSISAQSMVLRLRNPGRMLPALEHAVADLGYRLNRQDMPLDEDWRPDLSHVSVAYRRALWAVVLLHLAYGVAEFLGGFLAGSQALKADALDFLGDGTIGLFGLLAIGWSLGWRTRFAFVQGLFLGAMGVGVLAATAYRVLVLHEPRAELMGLFGLIALAVHVGSAALLIPHRRGDAAMRATWLFLRNDAFGNLAVLAAAALVWWTGRGWPDLAVAAVIAGLFLHSSCAIIRDAVAELRCVSRMLRTVIILR